MYLGIQHVAKLSLFQNFRPFCLKMSKVPIWSKSQRRKRRRRRRINGAKSVKKIWTERCFLGFFVSFPQFHVRSIIIATVVEKCLFVSCALKTSSTLQLFLAKHVRWLGQHWRSVSIFALGLVTDRQCNFSLSVSQQESQRPLLESGW